MSSASIWSCTAATCSSGRGCHPRWWTASTNVGGVGSARGGLIAGNHERARLPPSPWLAHENIAVFAEPRCHVFEARGVRLAVTGVPFTGDRVALAAARAAPRPAADGNTPYLDVSAQIAFGTSAYVGGTSVEVQ